MSVSPIVLDTSIVSYFLKGHELAEPYRRRLGRRAGALSIITLGEMQYGAERMKWGSKRIAELDAVVGQFLLLPQERSVARWYGSLKSRREAEGRPIAIPDAWIAASALAFGLPLMTHNRRDFDAIPGLRVISLAP